MPICPWALSSSSMKAYHDQEWGKPTHHEPQLFELLSLETYQAGLSWQIVLTKRAAFQQAFHDYDLAAVSQMDQADLAPLMKNPQLIRNRRKLEATVTNARAILKLRQDGEFSDFDHYLWHFVDGQPQIDQPQTSADVPSQSPLSVQIAKDMHQRGFKFVGPVIVYSYLQAIGMIDDHLVGCPAKTQRA